jgi:hypothetical protein
MIFWDVPNTSPKAGLIDSFCLPDNRLKAKSTRVVDKICKVESALLYVGNKRKKGYSFISNRQRRGKKTHIVRRGEVGFEPRVASHAL